MRSAHEETDEAFDAALGAVLRTGVLVSALVVLAGGVLFLVRHGREAPQYHVFVGEPSTLRSVDGIIAAVRTQSARGIIQLGLLLLIATPVARVMFSVVGFVRQRDWLYVSVTLVVLTLLAFSLLTG